MSKRNDESFFPAKLTHQACFQQFAIHGMVMKVLLLCQLQNMKD
jgi:hypothetical protein